MSAPTMTARVLMTADGPLYFASIAGGPQDLIARTTEAAALADGANYAAEHWGQRADGTWTPYREQWTQR